MVTIVSRYSSGFPGLPQKIQGGPIYADILAVIDTATMVIGTRKCRKNLRDLSKDADDLKDIIKHAVTSGKFHASEWCELSTPDTWAACDSYTWVEKSWIEAAYKEMNCQFYVKFCIGIAGNVVVTVSYHTS
ncbi:hypothetical protein PO654_16710 [Phytobacter diazotrophicus]|uniref:hypothetical protein n=1 Tax=Phytobacter diazotrophicus TaxID=395631 RepID=UPI0013ED77C4|nr:hypothetical protein [Phytobacter diazotrophicus]MDU4999910.1 hypothetical protein [Enterobacteriaceae bacterium]MDU6685332.1 hypothetical protein [Enterobacteriaceae bacterium]